MDVLASGIKGGVYDTVQEVQSYFQTINELYNQRSFLRMEKYRNMNNIAVVSSTSIDEKIEEIDLKLKELGVRKIASSELTERQAMNSIRAIEGSNETWTEVVHDSVYSDWVRYEVTVLTAESANVNSVLYDSASKTIYAAPGVAAETADYLRIYGTAASGIVGTVFGTIYDAVNTTISNLSTSTIIENVSATYNWQCDTLMHYLYVKPYGSTSEPTLCYVYNEVNTLVLGVTNSVRFNSTEYNGEKLNFDVYEKRSKGIMDYSAATNGLGNAINCYLNYTGVKHSFVVYVTISGAGNKSVAKNYVCQEVYPGLLY